MENIKGRFNDIRLSKSIILFSLSMVFYIIFSFTPSSKTLYLMLGVDKGQELFKEYKGNEILDKSSKLILKKLDEMLKEK